MNCKPNELAVIVRPTLRGRLLGKVVTTLYVAPDGDFRLPDGYKQLATQPSSFTTWWVVEFSNQIEASTTNGSRKTVYGCVPDAVLRPIRDNDGKDEILRIAGVPHEVAA